MKKSLFCIILVLLAITSFTLRAQVRVVYGQISIDGGTFSPIAKSYSTYINSLNKNLKANPNDTTSLFYRALLYLHFNDLMAKPYQEEKGTLENLTIAKDMVEKAVNLKMQSFYLRVLRAQIYKELTYRFTDDQSWKFNSKQIAERKYRFNNYKALANKYYDELAVMDKPNALDYQKLKVTSKYPF
jgi:hypothetical protein